MCGLVGFKTLENGFQNYADLRSWFKAALFLDQLRGEHSTGLGAIPKEKGSEPLIYKKAVSAADFLQLERVGKIVLNMDDFHTVIGHNRYATTGRVTDSNAHPFHAGPVVLAHNGTLTYDNAKLPHHEVDSARIALALAENPNTIDVLESLAGAYALSWYDHRDGTFNLCRNDERPLYYAISENEKTVFYASEIWILQVACSRAGITLRRNKKNHAIFEVPVGSLYQFSNDQKSMVDYSTFGFKPKPKTIVRTNYANSNQDWDNNDYYQHGHGNHALRNPRNNYQNGLPTVIPPSVNTVVNNVTTFHGANERKELLKFGLKSGDDIVAEFICFEKYSAPHNPRAHPFGKVLASWIYADEGQGLVEDIDVEFRGVAQRDVTDANTPLYVRGRINGIQKTVTPKGTEVYTLIGTYISKMDKPRVKPLVAALMSQKRSLQEHIAAHNGTTAADSKPEEVAYIGPDNRLFKKDVMEKMLESGCDGGCNQPVTIAAVSQGLIKWTSSGTPICLTCQQHLIESTNSVGDN
jgi:predicted glutamine amidotransferase